MGRDRAIREVSVWRLLGLWLAMLALFGALGVRLWRLQVAQGMEYQRKLAKQSLRSVRLPGVRGRILDRNGERLADNRPSYCVSLYLEELRKPGSVQRTVDNVMDTLYRLAETMDRPLQLAPGDVRLHLNRRTPLPLVAWRDLDETAVARFAERAAEFPGAELTVEPVRVYPGGVSACHLLGYVGRADLEAAPEAEGGGAPEKFHYYLPEMAGKSGVEKRLDGVLRANEGGRLEIQVDVAGFKFDEVSSRAPGRGSDVALALDARIQRAAEAVLAGERGAAVVVDPRNGDVLALASVPGYDPNDFVPAIPASIWKRLLDDPARPLVNRATAGEYAPGSTYKPVTQLAAIGTPASAPNRVSASSALASPWPCAHAVKSPSVALPAAMESAAKRRNASTCASRSASTFASAISVLKAETDPLAAARPCVMSRCATATVRKAS